MKFTEVELRNYFLGLASKSLQKSIEEHMIASKEFEAELFEAENALIEDYIDGDLPIAQAELFWHNFLITKEREERVEIVRQLKNKAGENEKS